MAVPNAENALLSLSERLGELLLVRGWKVATAESCTGGAVAAAITSVAGSSSWFEYGVVSYANQAKEKLLQVDAQTLSHEGAVSEAVVVQMVQGILQLSGAQLAVAVSGIAGPSGGSPEKPVGTVWFAWANSFGSVETAQFHFSGNRQEVQAQAVEQALIGLLNQLQ